MTAAMGETSASAEQVTPLICAVPAIFRVVVEERVTVSVSVPASLRWVAV